MPTVDEIPAVLASMPTETVIERRNQALIAFAILTGARDNAIASTKISHVDFVERELFQGGRDMRTKFTKSFPTFFFPVGDDIEAIARDWLVELREGQGFGPNDPLFPPTKVGVGAEGEFEAIGLSRECWANAAPIRKIFRDAFTSAGMPSYNPHSFRKTLVRLGLELGQGEAGLKAWSQNLGHDGALVTLKSYGDLPVHRQKELIRAAARANEDDAIAMQLGREVLRKMREIGAA